MNSPLPLSSVTAADLLRQWIGLDPNSIGEASIRRSVRIRMLSLGIDSLDAFVHLCESDRTERDKLVEEVVVAESWFFRDQQIFEFIRKRACSHPAVPGAPPIRILSAPCAAGEEPYSVAMTLLDAGISPDGFQIDAVDISRVALGKAAVGRYSANAFRGADASFRGRWFRTDGSFSILEDSVRSCVNFAWGNILSESFVSEAIASGRAPYDIILCRNLLIYLTQPARIVVEQSLDRLLKPDGMIVLGAAEPPILKGNWIAAGPGASFNLHRGSSSQGPAWPPVSVPRRDWARHQIAPAPPKPERKPESRKPAPPPALPGPVRPALTVAEPPPSGGVTLAAVLEEANALANARRFADAIALCETHQRIIGPSAELFFLAGMVHQSSGNVDYAEDCFQKALYIDPTHDEALLSLSLLAAQRGNSTLAAQYRDSAARIAERGRSER